MVCQVEFFSSVSHVQSSSGGCDSLSSVTPIACELSGVGGEITSASGVPTR